ncbi:MAG: CgeB family protein [Pseudomonadales bacterium]
MSGELGKSRDHIPTDLTCFSLQARLEQAEFKHKKLEESLSQLRSSFAFRVGRLVIAPAASLRRKIGLHKIPDACDKKDFHGKVCATEGAGGYLLSVVLDGHDSESLLKIEFYDSVGDLSYYYQYPLNSEAFVTPSVSGTPVIRRDGAHINLEATNYIGSEIAYLKAFIIHPNGEQLSCASLSIRRVFNSGNFNHLRKSITHVSKNTLRIACVLDEFTWTCLSPEANLVQLRPDDDWDSFNWSNFDFLFVESAWRGEGGLWRGALGGENTQVRLKLDTLLTSCRNSGVPSVFWNKEDPVHYEYFKSIAAQFDHIFTTDENVVEKYRNELSNPNVYCLPFFIQPEIHNPIKDSTGIINKVCFAGTWYGNHHASRTRAMQGILDAAVPLGLDIYDRMYLDPETNYRFPLRYWQFIRGRLSYNELCEAHKCYACFVNINTVTDSPSMCARRVFEVLASSTPVVSNPSVSLKKYFNGGVLAAHSQEEATVHFSRLLSDSTYRAKQGHLGFRSVMGEHTAGERLSFIAAKLGKAQLLSKPQEGSITFVSIANRDEDIQSILGMLRKFSIPDTKLLLGVTFNPDLHKTANPAGDVSIVQIAETGLNGYEILLDKVDSRFAIIVSPTVEYGANYVSDKLLCFTYMSEPLAYSHPRFLRCDNGIICRECVPEHEFTSEYDIDSMIIDLENEYWNTEIERRDVGWLEGAISCLSADNRIYAVDSFNFLKPGEESNSGTLRDRAEGYTEQDVFV